MGYTVQYYDLVLGAIAGSLLVGVAIGSVTGIAMTLAVTATGLLALAVVFHGLFVNGPVDRFDDLSEETEILD